MSTRHYPQDQVLSVLKMECVLLQGLPNPEGKLIMFGCLTFAEVAILDVMSYLYYRVPLSFALVSMQLIGVYDQL